MAQIFQGYDRLVPTWRAAARHLLTKPNRTDRNLMLEIADPNRLSDDDRGALKSVSTALSRTDKKRSLETVANTIFPQGLYLQHGRAGLYSAHRRIMARIKEGWGTYFDRMTNRIDRDGRPVNPLEVIIKKLQRSAQPGHQTIQSAYELCASDPTADLVESAEMGCELSTYDPGRDANITRGGPCLSHLSFKLTDGTHVDLTAMYRSHNYCARALGNLVGLSRLLAFVAKESGLRVGALSCLSTHAVLDLEAWGTAQEAKALLADPEPIH